jgi:hypothetical protein
MDTYIYTCMHKWILDIPVQLFACMCITPDVAVVQGLPVGHRAWRMLMFLDHAAAVMSFVVSIQSRS